MERVTQISVKHECIMRHYKRVIRRYPAASASTYKIYKETAKPFFISPESVGRVIRKKLKNGTDAKVYAVNNETMDGILDDVLDIEKDVIDVTNQEGNSENDS